VRFSGETASGWQEAACTPVVRLVPGTGYVSWNLHLSPHEPLVRTGLDPQRR
jgi:hypothetical protein